MSISAKVVCASINSGVKLTTLEVVMPRIILAEWNTHRRKSRNTSSSRAISLSKMRSAVATDPYIPETLARNQRGMQAGDRLNMYDYADCVRKIRDHMASALELHKFLESKDVHKQWTNRYLEPFMWSKVVVSATEWQNFLSQRLHSDAQPEMQQVAAYIAAALETAEYTETFYHLPYITAQEREMHHISTLLFVSAFRCAGVSYTDPGQRYSFDEELERGKRLAANNPPHWSPLEHCAIAVPDLSVVSNFDAPWIQARKLLDSSDKKLFSRVCFGDADLTSNG